EQGVQEEWVARFTHAIHSAPCLVVDTNLPPSLLSHTCQLAAAAGVPVWCDPVSVGKATRTIASLPLVRACCPCSSPHLPGRSLLHGFSIPYTPGMHA
ncbi:unnamed protein product, partial [Closterium sp. NIES-54]